MNQQGCEEDGEEWLRGEENAGDAGGHFFQSGNKKDLGACCQDTSHDQEVEDG